MHRVLVASIVIIIRPAFLHQFGRMLNFTVIAVVLITAIIGLLFITRGTAVRRVRGVGVDGNPVSPDEKSFPLAVSLLTGSTLLPGNQVELVLDGSVFPRLWADLCGAKTSIIVQMYYALSGKVTETLAIAVDPVAFRQRPMFEHVKEWAANQITRLL